MTVTARVELPVDRSAHLSMAQGAPAVTAAAGPDRTAAPAAGRLRVLCEDILADLVFLLAAPVPVLSDLAVLGRRLTDFEPIPVATRRPSLSDPRP